MKAEERYEHYYNEGYNAGCVKGYEQAIDKACEWMDRYIDNYLFVDMEDAPGIRREDFINDFRQVMKGGEE